MKRFNYYLSLMLLLVFTAACSDEFDQPPMVIPTAEHHANMTIAEFKAKYWQDAVNYIDTVKEDIVIHGWVTSSDESGNIYKALYITDESGAGLTISINQNSMYNTYRIGQEVVIPMKDYFVGKYNGQQQLGYPQWYSQRSVWEATFLPQAMWESMVEINGLPDLSKVEPVDVSIKDFQGKTDGETLRQYQGKLVRISGVHFTEANGVLTYSEKDATTNRTLADESGNQLVVRTSNYADFRADVLPDGDIDVIGLLSFYATSQNSSGTWQFYLRSIDDVVGGGQPGSLSNPYNVDMAIKAQNDGSKGWMEGYVVGAVAPEVTTVSSNSHIEWQAPTTLGTTLVLADDPDCTDYTKCIIIALPQGSPFRTDANLVENDWLYKKQIKVKGTFATYMGAAGITGNTGSREEYILPAAPPKDGVIELNEGFESAMPSNWFNVQLSGTNNWYQRTYDNNGYATMTGHNGKNPPFDSWLITPALDIKNATSKVFSFRTQVAGYNSTTTSFEVYVLNSSDPAAATVKVKLNPAIAQASSTSTYSSWVNSGDLDLSQWADGIYFIGFRYYAPESENYATWCVDDVKFGLGGNTPPTPTATNRGDFETMGSPSGQYNTWTSTNGWVATNSMLLAGGDRDSNPNFIFIGYMTGSETEYAYAPTLNGKTSSVGTLVSPVIHGGMTKLQFNYGAAMSDKNLSFRIDVKQNGSVVKTWTVTNSNVTQRQAYTFAENCSVNGDFTIEITNLCPSNSTSNKDRVSIWNLVWDPAQ